MSEPLEIPRSLQEDDYSCGAHCVKMVADFYKKVSPKTKLPYSITSIKRMCNTTKEGGTEIKDLDKGLKKLGLVRHRTTLDSLLNNGVKRPVITLIKDDAPNTDHYVLVNGILNNCMFSIVDPESHIDTLIGIEQIKEKCRKYDGKYWVWEVRRAGDV